MKTETKNTPLTPHDAVLEIQRAIDESVANIQAMQCEIKKTEYLFGQQEADLVDLEPLFQQRENLLADVAIGKRKAGEVDKLSVEIERLEKQFEVEIKALDLVGETLGGLKRRLSVSLAELVCLKERKTALLGQYLRSKAEEIGVQYADAAHKIAALYEQLYGISEVMKNLDSRLKIRPWGAHFLSVPNFLLPSMSAPDESFPGFLYHEQLYLWFKPSAWTSKQLELLDEGGIRMKEDALVFPTGVTLNGAEMTIAKQNLVPSGNA